MSSKEMNEFKDGMAKAVFGTSITEAWSKGICVQCREPAMPKCYSEAGKREYAISGLCELCFDKIMKEEE